MAQRLIHQCLALIVGEQVEQNQLGRRLPGPFVHAARHGMDAPQQSLERQPVLRGDDPF